MVVLLVFLTVAIMISVQVIVERHARKRASDLSPAASGRPISDHLFVHEGHTWACLDTSGEAKVGIDHFLLGVLGGVDRFHMPEPGQVVRQGEKIFSVFRGGHRLTLCAPIEGVVGHVNTEARLSSPGKAGAYRTGWLFTIRPRHLAGSLRHVKTLDAASSWFEEEANRFSTLLVAGSHRFAEVGVTIQDGGRYPDGVLEKMSDEQVKAFEREFLS